MSTEKKEDKKVIVEDDLEDGATRVSREIADWRIGPKRMKVALCTTIFANGIERLVLKFIQYFEDSSRATHSPIYCTFREQNLKDLDRCVRKFRQAIRASQIARGE